jgi:hypothetical protein
VCSHFDAATLISGAKDLAIAGAAVTTAIVAYRGLQKWREELRGKADFEVARGLVRATFKLRDEIQTCRSPLMRAAEYPQGYQSPNASQPANARVEADALAYAYNNRWQRVTTALQEFDAQTLEAEALWGADIRDGAQALRTCAETVFVAIESIIDDKAAGGAHFEQDREFGRRTRAQAHAPPTAADNPLSNQITAAVAALEAKLRGHLKRPK